MNKGVKLNKDVWNRFIHYLEKEHTKVETIADIGDVSASSLRNWAKDKCSPKLKTLNLFVGRTCKDLGPKTKEQLFFDIMKSFRVKEKSKEWDNYRKMSDKNYSDFLIKMLTKPFENIENKFLSDILRRKFEDWFVNENYISLEILNDFDRDALMLSICDENRTTYNILLSYDIWNDAIDKEIDSINKLNEKQKNNFIAHIAITSIVVPNNIYENMVKESNTYIKTISDREKRDVYNSYFAIHELSIEGERNYNAWADSIFRKFLESAYLIYKEILCKKYNFNNVGKNFLQTNIGIGNYPYAMRRAISFEKKRIEGELKKAVENNGGKVETILDLNCLGGLYGMRLSKYAKKVVCIDACKDVLDSIKETIEKYNELLPENNIRNVKYGLLREDSYDILTDEQDELKADCIIMGLGTLSYIEDPRLFISQIANYIKKDGFIFISCYNTDSLSIKLEKYENLNYRYDPYRKCFVYSNEKINMSIPVHLYTLAQFKHFLLKYFDVNGEAIWSYPTLVSIFQEANYANGIEVIKEMDKKCAIYQYPTADHGNYNMAILKKQQTNYVTDIHQKVIDTIHEKDIKYKSVYHDPIMSSEDLDKLKKLREDHVFITNNNFIKTLILIDSYNAPYTYYMVILPAKKKFQIENLRKYYKSQKREKAFDIAYIKGEIHPCDESDLIKMGITLGSISPFSYPALHSLLEPNHNIVLVYDCSIIGLPYEYIYTYSGKNNMSFEIKKEDFFKYLEDEHGFSCQMD